ncbi:MAG: hypothetical protein QG572_275 [Pseudomonadota bacterium]|nr:hypothetical protein [Pseudomonadota bacterium]
MATMLALSAQTHLLDLEPHPSHVAPAGLKIDAGVELFADGSLHLGFVLHGETSLLDRVLLPDPGAAIRVDGLWQHTCCEAFIGVHGQTAYREFNFSPSTAWAAYAFGDYRQAVSMPLGPVPPIAFMRNPGSLMLATTLAPGWLPKSRPLCVGLSAVVELDDGTRSYWALAHPAAQPDFHHRDSFTLILTE